MIDYFVEKDYLEAKAQRKKTLAIFFVVLGFYALFSAGMLAWYLTLPYMSPVIRTVKLIHYSVTALMMIFSFIYLGIPYKRVNRFYRITNYMLNGLRETSTGSFFEYDETLQDKDGVDFKSLVF